MSWADEMFPTTQQEAVAPFTLVGYRHIESGVLASARLVQHSDAPEESWEPVYTGGPAITAPLLECLIKLAEDRAVGERRIFRFQEHRWAAQRALGEFVAMGGQVP